VDPDALLFMEPASSKNVAMLAWPKLTPSAGGAWAPHIYGPWDFSQDAPQERDNLIELNMRQSALEAQLGGLPLWFGEFGVFNGSPGAEESMQLIYDLADEMLAGTALWELDDAGYGPKRGSGDFVMPRAMTVARPYPLRVGGRLGSVRFDSAQSRLELEWAQAEGAGETVIVVPELRYPSFEATLGEGVSEVSREPGRLVVSAEPGERSLAITP
jgi:hypothetical protein